MAFDTVLNSSKMSNYGNQVIVLDLFTLCISNRREIIKIGEVLGSESQFKTGVPL